VRQIEYLENKFIGIELSPKPGRLNGITVKTESFCGFPKIGRGFGKGSDRNRTKIYWFTEAVPKPEKPVGRRAVFAQQPKLFGKSPGEKCAR
jgi:hypothetical protein